MSEDWRNELITKGAAFDALKDNTFQLTLAEEQRCEGHVVWDEDVVFADVLEKALLALPSAQPQRMKGRWTRKNDGVYCSACYKGWDFMTGVPAEVETEYKFCPNCGADMRGEQDGKNS